MISSKGFPDKLKQSLWVCSHVEGLGKGRRRRKREQGRGDGLKILLPLFLSCVPLVKLHNLAEFPHCINKKNLP